jgi:hypothetical protein
MQAPEHIGLLACMLWQIVAADTAKACARDGRVGHGMDPDDALALMWAKMIEAPTAQ